MGSGGCSRGGPGRAVYWQTESAAGTPRGLSESMSRSNGSEIEAAAPGGAVGGRCSRVVSGAVVYEKVLDPAAGGGGGLDAAYRKHPLVPHVYADYENGDQRQSENGRAAILFP